MNSNILSTGNKIHTFISFKDIQSNLEVIDNGSKRKIPWGLGVILFQGKEGKHLFTPSV